MNTAIVPSVNIMPVIRHLVIVPVEKDIAVQEVHAALNRLAYDHSCDDCEAGMTCLFAPLTRTSLLGM